jgi:hypothetical protein
MRYTEAINRRLLLCNYSVNTIYYGDITKVLNNFKMCGDLCVTFNSTKLK